MSHNSSQTESNMEIPENESAVTCLICRGTSVKPLSMCIDSHEKYCSTCWTEYIDSVVHNAFMGSCPCITCPSEFHLKKRKRIIPYEAWSRVAAPETVRKYSSLANSLLAFLCGGCHSLKTLDVGYDSSGVAATKLFELLDGGSKATEVDSLVRDISCGQCHIDDAYERLTKSILPQLSSMSDADAFELFSLILKKISDPERRANFYLRYLRDRPRIRTLCCNREHCFHCKIKDFHEGKTCMEFTQTLDNSIITCPSCGIALAKGDGCNTITCVCGKQFSWSAEKETTDRCHHFFSTYPTDTNTHCAKVLCESTDGYDIQCAKSWQSRNRVTVSGKLCQWFQFQYPLSTSQCALVISTENRPEGVREAMELWSQSHIKEVEYRRQQNEISIRSIFLTMVPIESDRPRAANRILCAARGRSFSRANDNGRLAESASKWIESNKDLYLRGLEIAEERSALQFLFQHGSRPIQSIKPAQSSFPCAAEWCVLNSNHDLTYSNHNTTVERVGSVSCYPAAFSSLVSERCMFRVIIDSAPRTSNWLTFGVAARGMAQSSSDGVGRTQHSWGIADDRSSSAAKSMVAVCGTEVDNFRKLAPGDTLTAIIDVIEGWMELSINDTEYHYRFSIPVGGVEDYVFAMTFANDHRVSILAEPISNNHFSNDDANRSKMSQNSLSASTAAMRCTVLSVDQSASLNYLRRKIKAILESDEEDRDGRGITPSNSGRSGNLDTKLFGDSQSWLNYCGGSTSQAQVRFQELRPIIEQLVGCRKRKSNNDIVKEEHRLSWNTVVEAVAWYQVNRALLRQEIKAELAYIFQMSHGVDAPFLAAMTLQEYHNRRMSRSDIEAPLAFMQLYPDEMNDWYDNDCQAREPMIDNLAKGCRCLPRHVRICPEIKTKST